MTIKQRLNPKLQFKHETAAATYVTMQTRPQLQLFYCLFVMGRQSPPVRDQNNQNTFNGFKQILCFRQEYVLHC